MSTEKTYSYGASVKSDISDEYINTYLLRPLAGVLVKILYPTSVTPNQVTMAAILSGCLGAFLYWQGVPLLTLLAGLSLTIKDLLDSADGQLARAKHLYSRAGRFLDSIGDITVNALVFAAISVAILRSTGDPAVPFLGFLGFVGISLRVSYHVFYQTSFLHLHHAYSLNRTTEELREEDRTQDSLTLMLQRIFVVLYGWQDTLMARLDEWARGRGPVHGEWDARWYGDHTAVRLSGFLGLGTELFLLTVCSVLNRLELYLMLNVAMMNSMWIVCLSYRRWVLAPRLREQGS